MSLKSKIQALITAANAKTGETDATLTDAVQTLVDGYGQGGTPVINPLSVTENGTYTVPEGVDGFNPVNVIVSGGGGNVLCESGTISYHTGVLKKNITIPISDATFDNYALIVKAVNTWLLVDDVWVEQDGLDFTGVTSISAVNLAWLYSVTVEIAGDFPTFRWVDNNGASHSFDGRMYDIALSTTASASNRNDTNKFTVNSNNTITYSLHCVCNTDYGLTLEYTVLGWNNA